MNKLYIILISIFCVVGVCYGAYTTAVYKDSGGDRLVVASGGTLLVESGGTLTIDDGSLAPGDITLADTKLIIGAATGFGAAKSMSGDATIANTGAITIGVGQVEDSMIEGLATGAIILGVDGTAANNLKAVLSGDVTMDGTGAVTIGSAKVDTGMLGADTRALVISNTRHRVTVAEINAGHELLAAVAGKQYRLISCKAIAYGGSVGTTTTVDILGTQSAGSVKLVAFAQASLTQSAVLTAGGAGAAVVADGDSFVANDVNTAITINKTDGAADTATGVDIILNYVMVTP